MNARLAGIVVLAFAAGIAIGHRIGKTESRIEAVSAPSGGGAPSSSSSAATGSPSSGEGGLPGSAALSPSESEAVAGLLALRSGDYAAAVPRLEAAAAGIEAPELTAFRAAALEGAGRSRDAEALLKTEAEIEAVRTIARDAFMQHQDFMIAGPAYRLYLRLKPNAPQAPMMRQAIGEWEKRMPER